MTDRNIDCWTDRQLKGQRETDKETEYQLEHECASRPCLCMIIVMSAIHIQEKQYWPQKAFLWNTTVNSRLGRLMFSDNNQSASNRSANGCQAIDSCWIHPSRSSCGVLRNAEHTLLTDQLRSPRWFSERVVITSQSRGIFRWEYVHDRTCELSGAFVLLLTSSNQIYSTLSDDHGCNTPREFLLLPELTIVTASSPYYQSTNSAVSSQFSMLWRA